MKILTNLGGKRNGLPALLAALAMVWMLAAGARPALAQDAKLDLSNLDKLASKAAEVTNVNLEGPMIQMAAAQMATKAQRHGPVPSGSVANLHWLQQEAKARRVSAMLKRLKGIYVRTYEFSKAGEYSRSDVDDVLEQLRSGGWKSIVNVEEKKSGESTNVYMMDEGGETVGMAVVVAEPKELTVVNIVGPIDFSALGGLGGGLGALGNLGGLAGIPGAAKPQLQHRDQSDQTTADQAKKLEREAEQQRDHANQQKPNNQGDSK